MMKKLVFSIAIVFVMFSMNVAAETLLKVLELPSSPAKSEILKRTLERFEALNQDIKIEVISIPWGQGPEEVLAKLNRAGGADIIEMPGHWLARFANGELLYNLEDFLDNWQHEETLERRTMETVRHSNEVYTIPYGLFMRALFHNKALLKQAGIKKPPHTMDEFMAAAAAVSKIPGKSGYCFRGGLGGIQAWFMMAAAMNGSKEFFTKEGKSRMTEPGSIAGLKFLIDMYQKGYAPKESINWGFVEVVTNFADGNCAFLDQDPDALGLILKKMDQDDFGVTPMPVGPSGKAFPTADFGGWSILKRSKNPDAAWRLLSFLLEPVENLKWAEQIGILPIHRTAKTAKYLEKEVLSGWNEELTNEAYEPATMPTYLAEFGNFARSNAIFASHEALLGKRTVQELAELWEQFLTKEYAVWKRKNTNLNARY